MKDLDQVYRKFKRAANMSCANIRKWATNPCSQHASLSRGPLKRNTRLLCKPKSKWTAKDVKDAKRTISFVARMKKVAAGKPATSGCPSKRTISLRNWGHRA